jgi:hypothetical protein
MNYFVQYHVTTLKETKITSPTKQRLIKKLFYFFSGEKTLKSS